MKYTETIFVAVALLATSTYAEDPWTPSPLCPFPSEDLTRFPYEGDCSKYWECYEGARYPMDCPANLEFNAEASRCDDPSLANCDPDVTIIYPTYPHSPVPTVTTPDPGPGPECPFPSDELTFYPVANNCSQYWECYQGNRYLMNCPSNLFWNVVHNYCDFAENVDCSLNNVTTTARPTTTPGNDTTSPGNITTTTTDDSTTAWTPDPLCPWPSHEIVYYPHPTNCSQYYECYEGNKYLMSCPGDLYWNELANVCDYQENVNCNRNTTTPVSTTSTVAPNSTETQSPTATSGSTAGPNTTVTTGAPNTTVTTVPTPTTTINPICIGQTDGTYLPNPDDCSKYYECVDQKPKEGQCPGDLLWNEEILTCDYPAHVTCPNSTITTTAASFNFFNIFHF